MFFTRVMMFVGTLFMASVAASETPLTDFHSDIRQLIQSDAAAHAVFISRAGKPVFQHAQGFANLELSVKAHVDTVFEIGSITKQFTAVAILSLAQQNKLSLTDPITKFIPGVQSNYKTPTIHHLLAHTSGMVDAINTPEYLKYRIQEPISLLELIDSHKSSGWQFEPGERVNYTNVGYSMLAYVIEQASGQAYIDYLTTQFFKPLNMLGSSQASKRIVSGKATGYTFNGEVLRQKDLLNLSWAYGAGDLLSTVEDLNKWMTALMSGKLLNAYYFQVFNQGIQLNDGQKLNRGLSFDNTSVDGRRVYRMNGSTLGFSSHTLYMPEQQLFIAVLNNSDGVNGGGWVAPATISSKLLSSYLQLQGPDFVVIEQENIQIKNLVGKYRLEDGSVRQLTFENEQFFYQRNDGPKFQVLPMADNSFFFSDTLSYFKIGNLRDKKKYMDFYYFPDNQAERALSIN